VGGTGGGRLVEAGRQLTLDRVEVSVACSSQAMGVAQRSCVSTW
jgi:hypothetical protein